MAWPTCSQAAQPTSTACVGVPKAGNRGWRAITDCSLKHTAADGTTTLPGINRGIHIDRCQPTTAHLSTHRQLPEATHALRAQVPRAHLRLAVLGEHQALHQLRACPPDAAPRRLFHPHLAREALMLVAPMGASSSPPWMALVSACWRHRVEQEVGPGCRAIVFVDDLAVVHVGGLADRVMEVVPRVPAALCLPDAPHKRSGRHTEALWTGGLCNPQAGTFPIPGDKVARSLADLRYVATRWNRHGAGPLTTLHHLVARLTHIRQVAESTRWRTTRLQQWVAAAAAGRAPTTRPPNTVQQDLRWWARALTRQGAVRDLPMWQPATHARLLLCTHASLTGAGAACFPPVTHTEGVDATTLAAPTGLSRWTWPTWPGLPRLSSAHMTALEAVTAVVAWTQLPACAGQVVTTYLDNQAAGHILAKGRTRSTGLQPLGMWGSTALFATRVQVEVRWIPSELAWLADVLSRTPSLQAATDATAHRTNWPPSRACWAPGLRPPVPRLVTRLLRWKQATSPSAPSEASTRSTASVQPAAPRGGSGQRSVVPRGAPCVCRCGPTRCWGSVPCVW